MNARPSGFISLEGKPFAQPDIFELIERFYGCGAPIVLAALIEGETVIDLGSGGGIDCFILTSSAEVGDGRERMCNIFGISATQKRAGFEERDL